MLLLLHAVGKREGDLEFFERAIRKNEADFTVKLMCVMDSTWLLHSISCFCCFYSRCYLFVTLALARKGKLCRFPFR